MVGPPVLLDLSDVEDLARAKVPDRIERVDGQLRLHCEGGYDEADYEAIPEDEGGGVRYELDEGVLVVNASPTFRHQLVGAELLTLLALALAAQRPDLAVVFETDWSLKTGTIRRPDLVVVSRRSPGDDRIRQLPALVVEVRSPSTATADSVVKRRQYAEAGCPWYWLVEPDEPAVTVLGLEAGAYVERTTVRGEAELVVDAPVRLRFRPADLPTGAWYDNARWSADA